MWIYFSFYVALWTALGSPIVKHLTHRMSLFHVVILGNLFLLPFMGVGIFLTTGIPEIQPQFYKLLLIAGTIDAVAVLFYLQSVRLSPLSLLAPMSAFQPVFATFAAMIALGEIPTPLRFLGILCIVSGAYFLNIADIKGGFLKPLKQFVNHRGMHYALIASLLWGITPSFQKPALTAMEPTSPLVVSFVGFFIVIVILLPFAWYFKQRGDIRKAVGKNVHWFLILGLFGTLGQWAAMTSFLETHVGYALALMRLSTLFTIIIGGVFLKEERIGERLLGGAVMVAGTLLLVL